jgi:hypothetical protein
VKRILIVPFLFITTLSGCRDPGPSADVASTPATEAPAEAPVSAPQISPKEINQNTAFVSPLPGGIAALPFAYHVSVDRESSRKGGGSAREIGIELLGSSAADADATLSSLVLQSGGSVVSREVQGRAIRTVYRLNDGTSMLVWSRPGAPRGERFALQMPNATGTIYFAWPYSGS